MSGRVYIASIRTVKSWLAIVVGSCLVITLLWGTSCPLGVPGEWTWERAATEPDWLWNLSGGSIAAGLFIAFVWQGYLRLEGSPDRPWWRWETATWLTGLVVISFIWLWIAQEVAPARNRLGKSAFVLYYPGSSGYFTRARYDQPQVTSLLSRYEGLMQEGDVLHTGTHPPGLFLIFYGLIELCHASPDLANLLDGTQSASFREACDVIAANSLRGHPAQSFLPNDRRVLWLATLLVMACASLTVVPLYGLIRRTTSPSVAWICAALWPAVPALAIFIPKSDTIFPLVAAILLWSWLTAWDRRSIVLALIAGLMAWAGLICSLAFLPVFLLAGVSTLFWMAQFRQDTTLAPAENNTKRHGTIGIRRWLCVISACAGFVGPTWLFWIFARVNLLSVWWMNFRNHAGFYQAYTRTYWKWLLINPIELAFTAGWPIALLGLISACHALIQLRSLRKPEERRNGSLAISILFVWGLLWLTGKNSGEVARLWIIFVPWLMIMASDQVRVLIEGSSTYSSRRRTVIALLVIQFATCLFTVMRVSGFHQDVD